MRLALALAAFALASACASSDVIREAPAAQGLSYRLRADPQGFVDVKVAVPPGLTRRWIFDEDGVELVVAKGRYSTIYPIEVNDGEVMLPASCSRVSYRLNLDALDTGSLHRGIRAGRSALIAGASLLIRPARLHDDAPVELHVEGDWHLPWGDAESLRLRGNDLFNPGVLTLGGHRCPQDPAAPSYVVRILDRDTAASTDALCAWARQAQHELHLVFRGPGAPARRTAITLAPVPSAEPSPFGTLLRSDPPSVALLVGDAAQDFSEDWVAGHELMHLLHPHVGPSLRWLSEGLATYFQNVSRMRSGRMDAEEGWSRVAWGFSLGAAQAGRRSLPALTEALQDEGLYKAVYWGGAQLMLRLDLELRRRSKGTRGLEHALVAFEEGTLRSFIAAVDSVADAPFAGPFIEAALQAPAFVQPSPMADTAALQKILRRW